HVRVGVYTPPQNEINSFMLNLQTALRTSGGLRRYAVALLILLSVCCGAPVHAASLSGTVASSPDVNLSIEGTADWVHWGPGPQQVNRKLGGNQIGALTPLGTAAR